jgi:nitroimidazol reductase NimA-like FMN-containing flavoprotein (pyridoxamine 5'-phosphate oxidase superfamily)
MDREDTVRQAIGDLMEGQRFGVLCTQGDGQPYGSVVAYAYRDDLSALAFATAEDTHKYRLLCKCDRVALVADSRSGHPDDALRASAITATGRAVRLQPGQELERWRKELAARHPQLASFFAAPTSALFRVDVSEYKLVSRFQEARQWKPQGSR